MNTLSHFEKAGTALLHRTLPKTLRLQVTISLMLCGSMLILTQGHSQDLRVHRFQNDTSVVQFIEGLNEYDSAERATLASDQKDEYYLSKKAFDKLFEKYFSLATYNRESIAQGNSS